MAPTWEAARQRKVHPHAVGRPCGAVEDPNIELVFRASWPPTGGSVFLVFSLKQGRGRLFAAKCDAYVAA